MPLEQNELATLIREAHTKWPAEWLSAEQLGAHILEVCDADTALRGADLYLCAAVLAKIEPACGALSQKIHETATAVVKRMGGDQADADDVARQTVEKLVVGSAERGPRVADYQGRGSLSSWLRATVGRTFLNMKRKTKREILIGVDGVLDALGDDDASDPAMMHMKALYRAEFAAAFEAALAGLDDRQRALLRYRFVDGRTVDKIAAIYRVHRATCHRWISDARAALANATERLLREKLAVSETDFTAIRRLVASQLELSLSRIFAAE